MFPAVLLAGSLIHWLSGESLSGASPCHSAHLKISNPSQTGTFGKHNTCELLEKSV